MQRRALRPCGANRLDDLLEHERGLLAVLVPPPPHLDPAARTRPSARTRRLADVFDRDRLSIAAAPAFGPVDAGRLESLAAIARARSRARSCTCWLKRYHPAAFAAALINSKPMGFYAPAQIVRDAREHGVCVRAVDVERGPDESGGDTWTGPALRLGLRLVKGLREGDARRLVDAALSEGPFDDLACLQRASGASVACLRRLAAADAFRSLGLDRQAALWELRALRGEPTGALPFPAPRPRPVRLPEVPACQQVLRDFGALHLSLKAHPVSFLRAELERAGAVPAAALADAARFPHGARAAAAGLVLVRQRPGTASGIVFVTLEDESGIANLIVRPQVFERYREAARHASVLLARGRVERQGEVVHLLAHELESLDELAAAVAFRSRDFH